MKNPTISRKRWGARTPRGMARQRSFKNGTFLHWTHSITAGIDTLKEQCSSMRAIQSYHMDKQGWADIGYHYVIFQPKGFLNRARIFIGREVGNVPAAQAGHNSETLAIAIFMGKGDKLHKSTKNAVLQICKKHGISPKVLRGHGEVVATDCPGPEVNRWLRTL